MKRKIYSKKAVSEVIGVVLLLGIAVTLFAVLNFFVTSFSFNLSPSAPSVNLIGTIDKIHNVINIENNGGDSLEGNTIVIITIGSHSYQNTSSGLLRDSNANSQWDFGELVQFHSPEPFINKYIRATVVDPTTNTILLSVTLQKGLSS
jgi:flagellin-like protein